MYFQIYFKTSFYLFLSCSYLFCVTCKTRNITFKEQRERREKEREQQQQKSKPIAKQNLVRAHSFIGSARKV